MQILRIKLSGYRNIHDTSIELSPLVALVGLNNYGKSNLLDGLSFALEFIRADLERKKEMMSDEARVPINKKTAFDDFAFEVLFETTLGEAVVEVSYRYSFEWVKNEGKGARIKSEELRMRQKGAARFARLIVRTPNMTHYRPSRTGRADKLLEVGYDELAINRLQLDNELYYTPIISELNRLNIVNREFLNPSRAFLPDPFEPKKPLNPLNLRRGGEDIARVLHHLRQKHPDRFALVLNTLKALIPNIESLETVAVDAKGHFDVLIHGAGLDDAEVPFRLADTVYLIRVKEKQNNQATDLSSLSNGTIRILMLITFTVLAGIRGLPLIGFEELEDCVHPSLFRRLLVTLDSLAEGTRILITSHSPYLIQYLDLGRVYIGVPSPDGVARFSRVKDSAKQSFHRMARDADVSVGDLVFSLLNASPGEDDHQLLLSCLEPVQ